MRHLCRSDLIAPKNLRYAVYTHAFAAHAPYEIGTTFIESDKVASISFERQKPKKKVRK